MKTGIATRQGFEPALDPEEHVLLRDAGGYSSGRSWLLGSVCLTDRRLLFAQGERQRVEIPLSSVGEIGIERRRFVLAARRCLAVWQRDGDGGRRFWLTVPHVEKWWKAIAGLVEGHGTILQVDDGRVGPHPTGEPRAGRRMPRLTAREIADIEVGRRRALQLVAEARDGRQTPFSVDDIALVARLLDPAGARLVWYVWKNGHARLDELSDALGEASHMNILAHIREEVNPLAVRVLGRPLFVFERSRVDRRTGEHVPFSWWLNDGSTCEAVQPEFVDVLDESDQLLVLLDLPGVGEEDIKLSVENGDLVVAVDTDQQRCHERVRLPEDVRAGPLSSSYRNGVLQVRLSKERVP
ncbi:MAG: Hsp20/alpha crystallin family protein [Dehalococcoidia bacterium]